MGKYIKKVKKKNKKKKKLAQLVEHPFYTRQVKCSNHLFLKTFKFYVRNRDLSLMVKRVTFNHYNKGSNPLGLI